MRGLWVIGLERCVVVVGVVVGGDVGDWIERVVG